mgnify:CR=1 FL=1
MKLLMPSRIRYTNSMFIAELAKAQRGSLENFYFEVLLSLLKRYLMSSQSVTTIPSKPRSSRRISVRM